MKEDYYDILRINKRATIVEIKKAYRKLALEFHPDRNKSPNAHDQFVKIVSAYEILIDPIKRAEYDNFLKQKSEFKKNKRQKPNSTGFNRNYRSQNAEKYANMTYKEFENFVEKIILFGEAAKKTTEKGCAWIAAIIFFSLGIIWLLSNIFWDGYLWGLGLFFMFLGIGAYASATGK